MDTTYHSKTAKSKVAEASQAGWLRPPIIFYGGRSPSFFKSILVGATHPTNWAFPSLRRFMPHPSRTIRITGFIDFSLSHKAHRQYRLSFYLELLFLFQF